jgi:hypothetical protein
LEERVYRDMEWWTEIRKSGDTAIERLVKGELFAVGRVVSC